jgi:hypothetical protein
MVLDPMKSLPDLPSGLEFKQRYWKGKIPETPTTFKHIAFLGESHCSRSCTHNHQEVSPNSFSLYMDSRCTTKNDVVDDHVTCMLPGNLKL